MNSPSSSDQTEVEKLRGELQRLNKVVRVLMDRAERSTNMQGSEFSLFQTTVMLEDQVRARTAELQTALAENERVNRALLTAKQMLETEVGQRKAAQLKLEHALDDLVQAQTSLIQSEKLAALGSLVAGIAHELNTPIGNGLTVASAMEEEVGAFKQRISAGLKRSDLDHFVEQADEGSRLTRISLERAARLLRNFMQVAADQIGEQRRIFDLAELVQSAAITLTPMFTGTPYKLETRIPHGLQLDSFPGPLTQIISSLISNSLIHGFEGSDSGSIRIVATQTQEQGIEIIVSDDGNGIPSGNLPKIFDPFFTTKLGQGSSGLGLHIAHNIVTGMLGGQIHLESSEGEGTKIRMVIPLVAPIHSKDARPQHQE